MARVRLVLKRDALYEVRRMPGAVRATDSYAQRIADIATAEGKGTYAVGSQQGARRPQGRWRSTVVTADWKSMRNNLRHNTLIKALGRVSGG